MKIRLLMVFVIAMALGACATQHSVNKAMSMNVNYNVLLIPQPAANPTRVHIPTGPQGANSAGKKNGFVGYAKGEQGYTHFSIRGSDPADTCASGAKWVITQLRLASKGDPTTEKGSNFGAKQDDWLKDAFPLVYGKGMLFPQPNGPREVTRLSVFNANRTSDPVNVYYEVTLTDCNDTSKTITTDPMWRNEGRG